MINLFLFLFFTKVIRCPAFPIGEKRKGNQVIEEL
jgi:hypothetical protein